MLLPSRGAVPAPAGKGGSDRAAVLVGEPAQEVAKGLLRCRGGDVPAVVPDHVAEPEQVPQGRGSAVAEGKVGGPLMSPARMVSLASSG